MKQVSDLMWQSKANIRLRRLMLFGIRFVEVCTSSLIPSFIGLMLVLMNPVSRIMSIMCFLSLAAFVAYNWWFWMRYLKQRTNFWEFYVINGLTYLLYAVLSVLAYKFSGYFVFSVFFSNLRGLEGFGLGTGRSIICCHIIMLILMIICERYSRKYYKRLLEKLAENGADEIEMDPWGKLVAKKKNKKVEILSIDEMDDEMEKEKLEAAMGLQEIAAALDDGLWSKNVTKGRGEKPVKAEFDDPEEDLDINDYHPMEDNYYDYDTENLWNKEIYKGRTPIDEYPDEADEIPDLLAMDYYNRPEDNSESDEPIWSDDMYRGRNRKDVIEDNEILYDEDFGFQPEYDEYETNENSIWSKDMRRGRGGDIEYVKDYDETDSFAGFVYENNEEYDSENLWSEEFYKGKNSNDRLEKMNDYEGEEVDVRMFNTFMNYDSDNLWDNVKNRDKEKDSD